MVDARIGSAISRKLAPERFARWQFTIVSGGAPAICSQRRIIGAGGKFFSFLNGGVFLMEWTPDNSNQDIDDRRDSSGGGGGAGLGGFGFGHLGIGGILI